MARGVEGSSWRDWGFLAPGEWMDHGEVQQGPQTHDKPSAHDGTARFYTKKVMQFSHKQMDGEGLKAVG